MELISNACHAVFDQVPGSGRIVVGFSGGIDSTVLLHAISCCEQAEKGRRASIVALHVDHGLHPESSRWSRHCASVAAAFGVEFVSERIASGLEPGGNLEARARKVRYQVFNRRVQRDDLLLLAHHQDDQDESVLMHLLQGRGLFGMPARRSLATGRLLRPLLHLPRASLVDYAESHDLRWLEDPANTDTGIDRNFLRQAILPLLNARFPALSTRLARVIKLSSDTDQALAEVLHLGRNPLPLAVFDGLSRQAASSVLRHWLIRQDAAMGVSDLALLEFLGQLSAANDRQPRLELPTATLRRHRRYVYLVRPPVELDTDYSLAAPGTLELPHGILMLSLPVEDAGPDAAPSPDTESGGATVDLVPDVHPPVTVTFASDAGSGTSIRVRGHHRRPRDLMRFAGLPPWERDVQPLLSDRLGLLAIPGVAVRDPTPERSGQPFTLTWQGMIGRADSHGTDVGGEGG